MAKRFFIFILSLALAFSASPAFAQTPTPTLPSIGPIYIVQQGDTLWEIAVLFNTTVADIVAANNMHNANIYVGNRLLIPGLEGLTGILITKAVPYGETLHSLSRQYHVDEAALIRLNHIVSPNEVYAGYKLIILQRVEQPGWPARSNLEPGETMLELAVRQDTDPWTLTEINELAGTWSGLPDDVLYLSSGNSDAKMTGLPAAFSTVDVAPLPLIQGATAEIHIAATEPPASLEGTLLDRPLHFFQMADGIWVALQGIHAMTEPGIYPLRLEATLPDGAVQSFEQMVLVKSGHYPNDPILVVNREMVDPAVTEPEDARIRDLVSPATPERYWEGVFRSPGYFPDCYNSLYGNRRVYTTEDRTLTITGFHSGIDLCGGAGLPIYTPAPGVVIFAGPLDVRGNATIIDHGWGIYSGFWHQSEILVQVGQKVETGDIIGKVGGTGRVTGPHLHWEIWVNGVQVDPLDWLQESFP